MADVLQKLLIEMIQVVENSLVAPEFFFGFDSARVNAQTYRCDVLEIGLLPFCLETDSLVDILLITAAIGDATDGTAGLFVSGKVYRDLFPTNGIRAVNLRCPVICAIRVSPFFVILPLFGLYSLLNSTYV